MKDWNDCRPKEKAQRVRDDAKALQSELSDKKANFEEYKNDTESEIARMQDYAMDLLTGDATEVFE